MSDKNEKSTESSKNSEEQNLRQEIEEKDNQIELYREMQNLRKEEYYRMSLLQHLNVMIASVQALGEKFDLMAKKIGNQNKILAAAVNVDIE